MSAPPTRRPTIRDVAEHAGVSKSLVSLVLRDSPNVSARSRTAVLESIKELGYRPSATARSLVSGKSGMLGIVTSNALDFFFFEVIEAVSDYLIEEDVELVPLIFHGTRENATEQAAVEHFLQLRVEGLMLMGSALDADALDRLARDVPLTVVGRALESDRIDVVVSDDQRGGSLATQHVLDLGHRRIAHITGGDGNGAEEREAGFRLAAASADAEVAVVAGAYTLDGGRAGARRLLERSDPMPTAVVAANDLCAIGAIDELRRAGLDVPGDISVIGYDDILLAGLRGIDLTTINQPTRQIGQISARLTAERIATGRAEGQHVLIEPALVVRSTTAPA